MAKQDPVEQLKQDPKAAQLLGDREALAQLLKSKEAQTLAQLLQQMGGGGLRQAAEAAMAGDGSALGSIVDKVRSHPAGAKAMEAIDQDQKGK